MTTSFALVLCTPVAFFLLGSLVLGSVESGFKTGGIVGGLAYAFYGLAGLEASSAPLVPGCLLALSGALLAGIPTRKIITNAVKASYESQQKREIEEEKKKLEAAYQHRQRELEANYELIHKELDNNYTKKHSQLASNYQQTMDDLNKRQQSLDEIEKNLIKKENQLKDRDLELKQRAQNIIQAHEKLNQDFAIYDDNVRFLNDVYEKSTAENAVILASSEKLKGALGRIMPYKAAWKTLISRQNPAVQEMMKRVLSDAKMRQKARQGTHSHAPRQPIPKPPSPRARA